MHLNLLLLLCSSIVTEGRHFDGGSITWAPIDPYNNSSSVGITITQSYSWAYPIITCANNVPISTSGRSSQNSNLTCVVDCPTDGGYSTKPIDILTDCKSVSTSLGMMNSERSHNLTLTAGAHFYLANEGSAWVALNDPAKGGLQWSIVTFIDLRMRADGFINTPPVASVVSPQYAIVNRTIQINIPVSDANAGDDVRCRWSKYTAGYRRRKRSNEEKHTKLKFSAYMYNELNEFNGIRHIRRKRSCACEEDDNCNSAACRNTTSCIYQDCHKSCCDNVVTTTIKTTTTTTTTKITTTTTTTTTKTTTTTTGSTTTVETTTIETPGTLKFTSSYPSRQAIDECGGICYPGSVPNGTTLSNCTITFTGLKAGVWYAVAVQVEDFINETSMTPLSSVPVQFLIYVMPQPTCSKAPIILPVNGCLEVQVGISVTVSIYAMNLCIPSIANVTDIVVSSGINGMSAGNLTSSPTNSSLSYVKFTWIPQANQVGFQQLCTIAFNSEKTQSNQYCVTFTVKATSDLCVTTTTTSTSTTSKTTTTTTTETTTTTSQTTTTTTSTTTSETSTTTTETTTTSTTSTSTTSTTTSTTTSSTSTSSTSSTSTTSTSTSTTSTSTSTTTSSTSTTSTSTSTTSTSTSTTTSSTSTTSTSTSTTSTSTSTTTSSTSTTSTSTSTTSTSTSTTTTSVTTTTSTSTSATTATTTTVTTATTTKTKAPDKSTNWLLILGLSLLGLLLAICCSCCCLYWFLWGPGARRRRHRKAEDHAGQQTFLPRNIADLARKSRAISRLYQPMTSSKNHLVDNIPYTKDHMTSNSSSDFCISLSESTTIMTDVDDNSVPSTVSVKRIKRTNMEKMNNTEKLDEPEDVDIKPKNPPNNNENTSAIRRSSVTIHRVSKSSNLSETDKKSSNATSTVPSKRAVTVHRVRKSSNLSETDKNNSNINRQETLSATSTKPSKIVQVNVTKIPRIRTTTTQRPRASSVGNASIIQLDKSSFEMQPIANHSKTSMVAMDGKANKGNGVIMTKISRKSTVSQSHPS